MHPSKRRPCYSTQALSSFPGWQKGAKNILYGTHYCPGSHCRYMLPQLCPIKPVPQNTALMWDTLPFFLLIFACLSLSLNSFSKWTFMSRRLAYGAKMIKQGSLLATPSIDKIMNHWWHHPSFLPCTKDFFCSRAEKIFDRSIHCSWTINLKDRKENIQF